MVHFHFCNLLIILATSTNAKSDFEDPKFLDKNGAECPTAGVLLKASTIPGKNYAEIQLPNFTVVDNSGESIQAVCKDESGNACDLKLGETRKFKYSTSAPETFIFGATDSSGNYQTCRISLEVKDNEAPRVVYCPTSITVETSSRAQRVVWKRPEFTDNCGNSSECPLLIQPNIQSGAIFSVGSKHTINIEAVDPSRNIGTCTFVVEVKAFTCHSLTPPSNGYVIGRGFFYKSKCLPGAKDTTSGMSTLFICKNGNWMNFMTFEALTKLPACTVIDPATPPASCSSSKSQLEVSNIDELKMFCWKGSCKLKLHCDAFEP